MFSQDPQGEFKNLSYLQVLQAVSGSSIYI